MDETAVMVVDITRRGEFALPLTDARRLSLHPYCLWFPALDATDYESLGDSIQSQGLLDPIVLLDGQVFDGRHRLKACLERDVEPRFSNFEQLPCQVDPVEWVLAKNQYRRHLTSDQFLAIGIKVRAEQARLEGLKRKQEAGKQGAQGGRGRKKTLNPKSGSGFKRDLTEMHANSSAGQIAAKTGTSRYKVEQALKVLERAPELLDRIAAGDLSFAQAERTLPKPKRRKKPEAAWELASKLAGCCAYLKRAFMQAPSARQSAKLREQLIQWLTQESPDA
ncbi:MAG TPA: ParB N-terminal domain-containing protein [Bryobacteraceae bacterium]|jgi:ParB-like chromosome segregation protein Spo0J